jgi:GR25 family glycosyltransferase involved in LPS biosynthesis
MKSFVIILKGHEKSEKYGNDALSSGQSFGWDIERFHAFDGRKHSFEKFGIKAAVTKSAKCNRALTRPGVIGCFLSHYHLWKLCLEKNETIGIFEQDVVFKKPFENNVGFSEVLRLDRPKHDGKEFGTGTWWEGSHAYLVTPTGAKKLINWTHTVGAFPSDIAIGTKVVDIKFNLDGLILLDMSSREFSLTKVETF